MQNTELFQTWKASSAGQATNKSILNMFDLDNDGKITAKDFELMFNRQMSFLDENSTAIDKSLPFVGQCCFGVAAGWAVGYAARIQDADCTFWCVLLHWISIFGTTGLHS